MIRRWKRWRLKGMTLSDDFRPVKKADTMTKKDDSENKTILIHDLPDGSGWQFPEGWLVLDARGKAAPCQGCFGSSCRGVRRRNLPFMGREIILPHWKPFPGRRRWCSLRLSM